MCCMMINYYSLLMLFLNISDLMSFLCRVMKGRGSNVVFNKKYCGRDTTSLKFTGNETVKLLFKV